MGALASPALAQPAAQVGTLSCDVSAGVGMILMQKQSAGSSSERSPGSTAAEDRPRTAGCEAAGWLHWAPKGPNPHDGSDCCSTGSRLD